ncbi:MAG: STAS domain-containing protein [Flavobacteriales bacterium]|nr:STAS domain-containing protein [Flavobacteriales bacterium]
MQTNENNETLLDIDYKNIETDILLVSLNGRILDQSTSNEISKDVISKLTSERKKLILNLSNIDYINSNGLNSLISILTKTRTLGGEMVIFGISEKVNKLLVITKLSSVFSIAENLEEAKNKLN